MGVGGRIREGRRIERPCQEAKQKINCHAGNAGILMGARNTTGTTPAGTMRVRTAENRSVRCCKAAGRKHDASQEWRSMKCLQCGEEFTPMTIIQKYCSVKCRNRYCRTHNMDQFYPSITFARAQCGKTVVTEGGVKDKRSRFCSRSCEKKFWRHPHWESTSSRINFRSVQEYANWERRTNEG